MQNVSGQQPGTPMSPYLTPSRMENPIQTLPASPQLASQGYGQLQSWSGSPMRQSNQSQSPNVDSYPQQMTRYYQGSYANHQHSSDMPQYVSSSTSSHHTASAPYNTQYPASRQNSYPGVNVQQTYTTTVKPNYGTYYNNANPQAGGYSAENVAQRQTNYTNSTFYSSQKGSQCVPPSAQQIPHGTQQVPHGTQQIPHGSQQVPHGAQQVPHGAQQVPHGAQQVPHGVQQVPHGVQQVPHGVQQVPHGAQQVPHGAQQVPHGAQQVPHGAQQVPHGAQQVPHGAQQVPHGAQQVPHGTQQVPHGAQQIPHGAQQIPHSPQQIPHSSQQIPHGAQQMQHSVQQMPHNASQMTHNTPQMPHGASVVNSQPSYPKQPTPYQRYVNNYAIYQNENQSSNYSGKQQLTMPASGSVSSATVLPSMTSTQTNGQLSSIPTPPETSTPGEIPGTEGSSMDGTVDCIKSNHNSSSSFALPANSAGHTTSVSFSSSNVSISTTLSNSPENSRAQSWNTTGAAPPLQPPPNVDEGSQASSASASSSIPDEQNSRNAGSKPNFSYPPTPNTLSSPGAASMSSFHDDLECISSPGWPRTPASPVANNTTNSSNTNNNNNNSNYEFANIKRPESLLKLYTLSDEPERRYFLDKLIVFNEDRGSPITQCPTISKQPLDVFRVYISVKERGGFVEVTNAKRWKDIAGAIGVGASSSAAYTLRKQYMKLLLPFECKYDRGGIDPQPIINQVEASSRKKTKNATQGAQAMYGQGYSGHPMDSNYQPGYSECYPPSSRYPANSNTIDYRYVQNQTHYPQPMHGPPSTPVAGQPQYVQYARNAPAASCGTSGTYYQGNSGVVAPAYNSPQHPSVNSNVCRYSMNSATSSPVPPPTTESGYYPSSYASQQSYTTSSGNVYKYNYNNNSSNIALPDSSNINPQGSPVRTVVHRDQLSPYNAYASTDVMPSEKVATASESISQCKVEPTLETSGNDNSQSSESTVSDTALPSSCNTTPFIKKEVVTQDSCTVAVTSCSTPTPVASPYQSPAVESNKTFPTNCPSTPPTFSNHNSPTPCTPSYNQQQQQPPPPPPPPTVYPNSYHPKVQPHSNQFAQYVANNAVNENYRGSEGPPPNFTQQQQQQIKYNGMANSKEALSSVSAGYPCTNFPPKTNVYPAASATYNHPQASPNKEQYQMGFYKDVYNSPSNRQPVKGWGTAPCYSYQPAADVQLRTPNNSSNSSDMKPFPEATRPFPQNKCESPQLDIKTHVQPTPPTHPVPANRVQPPPNHMVPPHCFMSSLRKPMEFPADSVEAVKPLYKKRRRYSAKRVSPLDPWRLMLALKSGLLVESTWALDALSVLLCDNSSTVYFRLSHLPGLLSVLVEHYRRFLNKIFGLFDDLEVGCSRKAHSLKPSDDSQSCLAKENSPIKNGLQPQKKPVVLFNWLEKTKVLNTSNFTFKTRCKKNVQVDYDEALFLIDPDQKWDKFEGFNVKLDYWSNGFGEITDHIQVPFEPVTGKVQFARDMDKETPNTEKENVTPVVVKELSDRMKDCDSSFPKLLLPSKGEPIVLLKKCNFLSESLSCTKVESVEEQVSTVPENLELSPTSPTMERKLSFEDNSLSLDLSKSQNSLFDCKGESNKNANTPPIIESNPFAELKTPADDNNESELKLALDEPEDTKVVKDDDSQASFPRLRCPSTLKRPLEEELDDEAYCFDRPSLNLVTEHQDAMIRRCMCVSNILRNLSFVPGNDLEMNKNSCFLLVLGRLLLLFHEHKPLKPTQRKYDKEVEVNIDDSCISLRDDYEWWQSLLHVLRDNTLVTLSNIAGQLDLTPFPEEISLPLLDGLLHWVTCPSSYARDPIPVKPSFSVLTPQRLALEILCKLSVLDNNVDLMMATPPWSRIEDLFEFLARSLSPVQDKVVREFSIVLLSSLSQADSSVARAIAGQGQCISYLIGFIEQAEASAFQIASTQGTKRLKDNPELVGTTPNMVLRAAVILKNLASVSENRTAFFRYQQRLLTLVTSQIIDQELASVIAEVLFHCSGDSGDNEQLTSFSLS